MNYMTHYMDSMMLWLRQMLRLTLWQGVTGSEDHQTLQVQEAHQSLSLRHAAGRAAVASKSAWPDSEAAGFKPDSDPDSVAVPVGLRLDQLVCWRTLLRKGLVYSSVQGIISQDIWPRPRTRPGEHAARPAAEGRAVTTHRPISS